MEVSKQIATRLAECAVMFPSYGQRSAVDQRIVSQIFCRELRDFSETAIDYAFGRHLATGERFPTVADIVKHLQPVKVYRCDNGPDGFGAMYHADHPYIAQQRARGANVERYAQLVTPDAAHGLHVAASMASLPAPEDDRPPVRERSSGGGLRRIGKIPG